MEQGKQVNVTAGMQSNEQASHLHDPRRTYRPPQSCSSPRTQPRCWAARSASADWRQAHAPLSVTRPHGNPPTTSSSLAFIASSSLFHLDLAYRTAEPPPHVHADAYTRAASLRTHCDVYTTCCRPLQRPRPRSPYPHLCGVQHVVAELGGQLRQLLLDGVEPLLGLALQGCVNSV